MCKKELKIHIERERERERERESTHLFVWAKYRQNGRKKKKIFIVKKNGEKKSQNKRNMKGLRNCKVKVQSSGEIKR